MRIVNSFLVFLPERKNPNSIVLNQVPSQVHKSDPDRSISQPDQLRELMTLRNTNTICSCHQG